MELKPGYKQTEVGVIPEDWEVKRLGEIGESIIGLTYRPEDVSTAGTLVLRSSNIQGESLLLEDTVYVSSDIPDRIRVRIDDVLICVRNGSRSLIGKCLLLDERTKDETFGAFMSVFRSSNGSFVYWCFQTNHLKGQIGQHLGATINQITNRTLNSLVIPYPPLPEQKAIAKALSDMDSLLSGLDSLIAKKRDIKQATMQQLLTGKTRLLGFSGEWEVKRLGELFTFSGGYSASREQLSSEGHCYLHYGDIHGSNRTFIDVDADVQSIPKLDVSLRRVSPVSLLRDGDVVFVDASEDDAGASKHVVVVSRLGKTFISGLHTIIAKALTDKLDNGYKRYCFQTTAIKKQFLFYAVGTKVTGISKSNIPRLLLPVPPLPEQQAIAKVLTDMDAELEALEQRRDKTRELKQAMMQELLTGRTRLV